MCYYCVEQTDLDLLKQLEEAQMSSLTCLDYCRVVLLQRTDLILC